MKTCLNGQWKFSFTNPLTKEIVNDLEDTYESETKEIESRKAIVYKKQMTGSPIDKFSLLLLRFL